MRGTNYSKIYVDEQIASLEGYLFRATTNFWFLFNFSAAAANNPRGASAAPNVTVDATGRPSPTQSSLVTAGSQIRVAAGTSQQLLNQVLGARVTQSPTTKLQVVHAPQSSQPTPQAQATQPQQSQTSTQQNQQQGGDQNQQKKG